MFYFNFFKKYLTKKLFIKRRKVMIKQMSARNRTLVINNEEKKELEKKIFYASKPLSVIEIENKIFNNDLFEVIDFFPQQCVDLIVIDPPYNISKNFGGYKFNKTNDEEYIDYLESWFPKVVKMLKSNGSLYICCDWQSSSAIYQVISRYMIVRNRISWQREKGRGAKKNWKNCMEDVWFATMSNDYFFDIEAVKMKRKVIAPYRKDGKPRDWEETEEGNYRLTYPSNFWDDITIPFWSMKENTPHPTQKPEKLIAKLILASSKENDLVFDPYLGSGTTCVVAKKLNRQFCGIEVNEKYCFLAEKRLKLAENDKKIQGYDGVFWERNSLKFKNKK